MYKIYINSTPVFLVDSEYAKTLTQDAKNLVNRHINHRNLFQVINLLENNEQYESVTLHSNHLEQLKSDFFGVFKIVEAAGGVVFNESNEALMIFRRGFWDLPKGKIDKGETKADAAVREVQEETGVQQIELLQPILTTYHTYRNRKNVRCLKPTYWYLMKTTDVKLIPQTEEDIEKAVWMNLDEFLGKEQIVYGNILDVLSLVKS